MFSLRNYFLPTLCLIIIVVYSFSAFADILCLKNNNLVNNKDQLRLKNIIRISATTCPRGFQELINSANYPGDQGNQGESGLQGPDGQMLSEPFFFRGSTGEDNIDSLNFKVHFSINGISNPTDLASDVASIVGRDCNSLETTFKLSDSPGNGSGWNFSLERISPENFGSGGVDAVIPICNITGSSDSCTFISEEPSFILSEFDYILAKVETSVGNPNDTRVLSLVRCLD